LSSSLVLKIKYDITFLLFAIKSDVDDFQLAYFLNKSPFFRFKRDEDDINYSTGVRNITFSKFIDNNLDEKKKSFLLQNKIVYSSETSDNYGLFDNQPISRFAFLLKELKDFNYLLKLDGIWNQSVLISLYNYLNSMQQIETVAKIDVSKVKSINNLVF